MVMTYHHWEISCVAERSSRFRILLTIKLIYIQCHFTSICFKDYITQELTSILNTLSQPFPEVQHDLAGHFCRNGSHCWGYCSFECSEIFKFPQGMESHGIKSGERGGLPMSPRNHMTCPGNSLQITVIETLDECSVTSSCWKHRFSAPSSLTRERNRGRRKFSSITV